MTTTNAGTTILITGATSGIGRDAALHLAAKGFRVIASGRNAEALASLATESGGRVETLALDVTSQASIDAAAREVDARTGGRGVDVLINNAGYGWAAPALEMSDADLRAMFETNVFGLMAVTRAFVPKMIAQGEGRVLNVSSVGGRMTFPMFGGYNGTKHAVESLSDALRVELAPFGVRVVLIEPGATRTSFASTSMKGVEKYRSESSPWASIYARSEALRAQTDAMSAPVEVITRVIERAVTARRPAARYVAPFSARVTLFFVENLPSAWTDWLMARAFGIHAARLAPPARSAPAAQA